MTNPEWWLANGPAPTPERPWFCARCRQPAFTEKDREQSTCVKCRERAERERTKHEKEQVNRG